MPVRAKFVCTKKEQGYTEGAHTIEARPVYDTNPENARFFQATPGGELRLQVVNDAAASQFEEGKEFYVDFTPVEAASADTIGEPYEDGTPRA